MAEAGKEAVRPPAARFRRGPVLAGLLPGLPQVLQGRPILGAWVLALWIGLAWIVIARWERVAGALGGPWDHRLAFAALLTAAAAACVWSVREALRVERKLPRRRSPAVEVFRRNRMAVAGGFAVATLCTIALLTPFIAPVDPAAQGDLGAHRLVGPSSEHLLGTDQFARDVLSRLLYGTRISLVIGIAAAGIAVTIGTLLGASAGYFGGRLDGAVMRFVDVVIAFPRLVLLIAIIALFQPGIWIIVVVLGLTQWPHVTRLVRGEVLSLRERDFIQAGRALGFSRRRIILRHLIPNALVPVIVAASLGIGDTIVLEAGLSFLGLGVQPPTPSWGTMLAEGRAYLLGAWWLSLFPGVAIVLTVLSFNLVGDGLRDALDPRMRGTP